MSDKEITKKRAKRNDCYFEVQMPKRFNDPMYVCAPEHNEVTSAMWDSIRCLRKGESITITKQADKKIASDIRRGRLREWEG